MLHTCSQIKKKSIVDGMLCLKLTSRFSLSVTLEDDDPQMTSLYPLTLDSKEFAP